MLEEEDLLQAQVMKPRKQFIMLNRRRFERSIETICTECKVSKEKDVLNH